MTIVFMSFLSAILSELVSRKLGFRLLFPLVASIMAPGLSKPGIISRRRKQTTGSAH